MTRYVFDTNVIVSALLFHASPPGQAFAWALEDGMIVLSAALLGEVSEVLSRAKFDRYVERDERDRFLSAFLSEATLVDIHESVRACRDPKDDQVLELAVNGRAACIITGDADLLALDPFRGITILTPADFLRRRLQAFRTGLGTETGGEG